MAVDREQPDIRTIRPMLAELFPEPFSDPDWLFEVKWDGVRALAAAAGGRLQLISRNQNDLTPFFPELSDDAAAFASAVFDGEIVAFDNDGRADFQKLQRRLGVGGTAEIKALSTTTPVLYYVFDLLFLDGEDLRPLPLIDRKKRLAAVWPAGLKNWRLTDYLEADGEKLFAAAKSAGLEGIIAKRRDSPYAHRRSPLWRKIKVVLTEDFVVGGYTAPRGRRPEFGALILGAYRQDELINVGQVGTGFGENVLKDLSRKMRPLQTDKAPFKTEPQTAEPAVWLRPELVAEIKFTAWTDEGRLRHPSFVRLRPDKDARECVLEHAATGFPAAGPSGPPKARPRLTLTNLDKIFWPRGGLTKGDLINYYRAAAFWLLPHIKDRPMVLKRYPNGIEGDFFWQKNAPAELPDWVETATINEGDGDNRYILVNQEETLIYLANLACVDLNPWSSRKAHLDRPDWLIIDLDPFEADFRAVLETALSCREVLDQLELTGYPKTSGATGLHILVPLAPVYTYKQVRQMAKIIAILVREKLPRTATIEPQIADRSGRVYVDWGQNVRGKTIAAVYSVRPEPEATVSTPLFWSEIEAGCKATDFNLVTVPERLKRLGDIFAPVLQNLQKLETGVKNLK